MVIFSLLDLSKETVAGKGHIWKCLDDIALICSKAGISVEMLPEDVAGIQQRLCLFFPLIYAQNLRQMLYLHSACVIWRWPFFSFFLMLVRGGFFGLSFFWVFCWVFWGDFCFCLFFVSFLFKTQGLFKNFIGKTILQLPNIFCFVFRAGLSLLFSSQCFRQNGRRTWRNFT